ncbi:MAG: helix-turn-helix domain-containing protein [Pseudomonadota bacterium]
MQDNSAASQRSRILRHLQEIGPITTLQARHLLDIMHPAQRCLELRKSGFPIETVWVNDLTPEGNCHRVARYVLSKPAQLSLLNWASEV